MRHSILRSSHLTVFALGAALLLAACELAPRPASPTPPTDATPTLEASLTLAVTTATPAPATNTRPPAQIESPSPTWTPGPPTQTLTPSSTPGPFEYVIQQGDTLLYIIRQAPFNYRDTNVLNEILQLNPQISSIDLLPPPGSTILIPRQTLTPTPEGFEATLRVLPPTQPAIDYTNLVVTYVISEGETILGVAGSNSTTLGVMATLNPDIAFFGCDFTNPIGGPDCNVSLIVGQSVNVPALTPTPTLSPTFSGSETPTSTPTFPPPQAVFPPENAAASARTFQLQWLSVGMLQDEQVYVVQIEDTTAGTTHTGVTRSTSYELPRDMLPTDGQAHTIRWRVSIGTPNDQGAYRLISGEAPWNVFQWQSR
ncbi:MAG: LysM peptidoglycan-binding domain-containing protein [Pleurocapsa minor GSE-CHR-MK-17-07R]|jgi:hypothetical protein|nr:LysM peptidoglycan-binding domain-containing protein [Pleurocapsa minor GSE-CHR-MK 17-07R]